MVSKKLVPRTILLAAVLVALPHSPAVGQMTPTPQSGASARSQSFREQKPEFFVTFQWFTAPEITARNITIPDLGTNDVVMQIADKDLYGLGLGWNVDEHWNIWGDMTFGSPKYKAQWGDREINGRGNLWMGRLNADYNLLDRPFTPFVSGGIGFTYFDSRVPSGDTDVWCWWDYYWGYVCSSSTPTHAKWSFSPNLGAGVRWDVNDMFFIKAAVNWTWVSIGEGGSEPYLQYVFNAGWPF